MLPKAIYVSDRPLRYFASVPPHAFTHYVVTLIDEPADRPGIHHHAVTYFVDRHHRKHRMTIKDIGIGEFDRELACGYLRQTFPKRF